MDLLTGKGSSKRHEIWYFAESNLGALRLDDFKYRFIDQPEGWPGPKVSVNMPILTNIKQDPFERTPITNLLMGAPTYMNDFMAREFWRFVYVQQKVGELAQTAIEFPPMQKGASFNLQAVKERSRPQSPRDTPATETQSTSRRLMRGARSFDLEMVSLKGRRWSIWLALSVAAARRSRC